MYKKGVLTVVFILSIIGLIGCGNEDSLTTQSDDETDQAENVEEDKDSKNKDAGTEDDSTRNEETEEGNMEEHPHFEESREKLEKLTDDEIKELLKKSTDNNHQITEDFTEDDVLILKTLTGKEYYDLVGMTEDEVLNWIDIYHQHVNSNIIYAHQDGGVDSDKYNKKHRDIIKGAKVELEWIRDNYNFERKYHNDLIQEILDLMDAHAEGDNDALFSLKSILHELNQEFNPESFDEERATHLSLSNAVRIQNGQAPLDE